MTRQELQCRLEEIGVELTGLSQENMKAIKVSDWKLVKRIQKQTEELQDIQAEIKRHLEQMQF